MKNNPTSGRFISHLALHAIFALGALVLLPGCHRDAHDGRQTAAPSGDKHVHAPPHGGTAVVLGNEAFHLEFLRDAIARKFQVYVMDGELEKFIRISVPSFTVTAAVGGQKQTLTFKPVANPATGETVGDTSLYEAQADWIGQITAEAFNAVVDAITIKGVQFKNVKFNFPNGNEEAGEHAH